MKTASLLSTSSLSLPANSYVYKIVTVKLGNGALAAISSDDSLRVVDAETLQLVAGGGAGAWTEDVHDGVTGLVAGGGWDQQQSVVTAGRDAAVRGWDLRSGEKMFEVKDESCAPFLSLDCGASRLAAGTELTLSQATVAVWDHRSTMRPIAKYVESHSDDVTCLRFDPNNPAYLLSGSTDGLVNIYDTTLPDEEDGLIQIVNHGSSIHRAGFLSESEFYALSHDEILSVYQMTNPDLTTSDGTPLQFGNLRPVLNCEYIVDIIPLNCGEAIIGAGTHSSQDINLTTLQSGPQWSIPTKEAVHLNGAHGSEIVRSLCLHHASWKAFTAGEDGLVKAWQMPVAEDPRPVEGEEDEMQSRDKRPGSKERKKTRPQHEKDRGRFAPY